MYGISATGYLGEDFNNIAGQVLYAVERYAVSASVKPE